MNYPSGAFGSFLSHCLYKSQNVYSEHSSDTIFDSQGAAHVEHPIVFKNFHTYYELIEWEKKETKDKIEFLEKNQLIPIDKDLYYVLRIVSPTHTNSLSEIFNIKKIVEIKAQPSMANLLSKLILNKIYLNANEDVTKRVPELKKYNAKLYPFFAARAARFFVEATQHKTGDLVIDFEDFFSKEKFMNSFGRLTKNLNLTVDKEEIKQLYNNFESANEKYFSMYKNEKVLK